MRQAGIFAGQNLPSALAETAGIRLGRKLNIKGEIASMQKTNLRKWLSCILCMVLIAAMALVTTGCKDSGTSESEGTVGKNLELPVKDGSELGNGETAFELLIADKDGNETHVTIHTDKTIVGEALQEIGLLEGEEGSYGLYVKSVNGIRADYDKDGVYWAFYIGDEYATGGIDTVEIEAGASYALKVEK